jgi:hypothetical protein
MVVDVGRISTHDKIPSTVRGKKKKNRTQVFNSTGNLVGETRHSGVTDEIQTILSVGEARLAVVNSVTTKPNVTVDWHLIRLADGSTHCIIARPCRGF